MASHPLDAEFLSIETIHVCGLYLMLCICAQNPQVASYGGCSKKGYAPYNPRKQNQDSILMELDKATGALLLATLDGHGEAGDKVSQHFTCVFVAPPLIVPHIFAKTLIDASP